MKIRSPILKASVTRGIAAVCAAVFVTSADTAQAGINVWTSHGPYGPGTVGIVRLAIDRTTPGTLYAGASNSASGVFKSTNAGVTWSAAPPTSSVTWATPSANWKF